VLPSGHRVRTPHYTTTTINSPTFTTLHITFPTASVSFTQYNPPSIQSHNIYHKTMQLRLAPLVILLPAIFAAPLPRADGSLGRLVGNSAGDISDGILKRGDLTRRQGGILGGILGSIGGIVNPVPSLGGLLGSVAGAFPPADVGPPRPSP
jgi:hypothetical protein